MKKSVKKFLNDNPEFITHDTHEDYGGKDKDEEDYEDDDEEKRGFRFSFSILMRHISALAPALLFMAAIMLLTFQPSKESGELSIKFQEIIKTFLGKNTPAWLLNMKVLRAFAHVFLYLPLGAAFYYALRKYKVSWGKAVFTALMISSAFGLADEAIKMFLPGREFDIIDWVLDILGNTLGIFFALLFGMFARLFMLKLPDTGTRNEGG